MVKSVEQLAAELLAAKAEEAAAKDRRISVEDDLIKLLDVPQEGSKTHNVDGYKIVVKGVINRKLDEEKWAEVADRIPENLRPVKTKLVLDETGVKWLQKNDAEHYAIVAEAITSTPGKTSVSVERKE
jgi:hypothetical protein